IRPGPIQGDMVHPYLNRRAGREEVTYFLPELEPILKRTLGVPLFQEQMLKIAMVAADFSGDEAEELRRALSFHRSQERMEKVSVKLRAAMQRKNISAEVIEKIMQSITSFALYGFPESHAISFAILAYGSAYLKAHRAPEFYASLLNNQPMGFYSPATIVKDASRHGLRTLPICVAESNWNCVVVSDESMRLGFCVVHGLRREHAEELVRQRTLKAFSSLDDFRKRVPVTKEELRTLALLGALNSFSEHRRHALWEVEESHYDDLLARASQPRKTKRKSPLAPMTMPERVQSDYETMRLTTGPHPMKLLRAQLPEAWRASDLAQARHGSIVQIAGNVICRQRPGTAKGFVFISLEDETGVSNAIVTPDLFEKLRLLITEEPFLIIEGEVQNSDGVVLIKTRAIKPIEHAQIGASESHDFH
ncbi:MAG: error-prone DNA polymerase, partial [Verrucomicrobiota bacterium]|nr:error-prone DNA polymerase [Verrucomicrobiota bacterium]